MGKEIEVRRDKPRFFFSISDILCSNNLNKLMEISRSFKLSYLNLKTHFGHFPYPALHLGHGMTILMA